MLFCSIFIWGCSTHQGMVKRDVSEFIPQAEAPTVYPESFSFVQENYPERCRWEKLKRVVDGDTIEVGDDERVRFIGIDTPESKDERKPLQKGALEATAKTKELLSGSDEVCLIDDPEADQKDTYGRTLAYVFSPDGVDINGELLKTGRARGYFYFPFSRRLEFEAYLQRARDAKLGLWQEH